MESPRTFTRRHESRAIAAGLLLAALFVYLVTASYSVVGGDGSAEMAWAVEGGWNLRSYHLLQTALYRSFLIASAPIAAGVPAFVVLQMANGALGAVSAGLVFLLFLRCRVPAPLSALAASVWALSAAVWEHSVTADTGVTPMPLVLGAALLVLPAERPSFRAALGRTLGASALLAASATLSLNLALLCPLVLLGAWQMGATPDHRRKLAAAALGGLAVLGVAPFLAAAASVGQASPRAFLAWLTHHPETQGLTSVRHSLSQLPRAFTGLGRLLFPAADGETAVKGLLEGHRVRVDGWGWLALGRNATAAIALVGLAARGAWLRRADPRTLVLVATAVPTALFSLFWLGSDPQFWLPVYPFLLALSARCSGEELARSGRDRDVDFWWRGTAAALLVVLFWANHVREAPTPLSPHGGPGWEQAERAAATLRPGDVLIGPGSNELFWAAQQRPGVRWRALTFSDLDGLGEDQLLSLVAEEIDDALDRDRRAYVFGLSDPVRPRMLGFWELVEGKHGVSRERLAAFLDRRFQRDPDPAMGDDVDRITRRSVAVSRIGDP